MIEEGLANDELLTLTGIQKNYAEGLGWWFSFMLSNGAKSTQRGDNFSQNKMPKDAEKRIRSVDIYHIKNCAHICGFIFFDRDRKMIFKVVNGESDIH